ncbi:hypothetical protein C2W62_37345 [Candidatus Entotheonella serta]|nr:hypothetical protein C2W62_37345 [Candidatus Entotheonella serta]
MMYANDTPFRIKRRAQAQEDYGIAISQAIVLAEGGPLDGSSPGDITKWMAVPWQSDTSSCLSAYPPTVVSICRPSGRPVSPMTF